MPSMIFHAAYRLNPNSTSGSAIRPIAMKGAFEDAGFEVYDLTGTAAERRNKFKELKSQILNGKRFEFMYSESSTIPPMIGDPKHFPHPIIDAQIFAWLKRHDIPQSVFYRDIYWRFDEYVKRVGKPIAAVMRLLYKAELAIYRRFMSKIYVPSLQMAAEVPQLSGAPVAELPPGGNNINATAKNHPIRLLYVGNVGPLYRLHELVAAIKDNPDFFLTICTGKDNWLKVADDYQISNCPNINVVHRRGNELLELYKNANIATIVLEPSRYRGFAAPIKLFEYINYGKPILVSSGTLASKLVINNNWGWAIDNDREDITHTLRKLSNNPELITRTTEKVIQSRSEHTWLARARKVISDLTCLPQ